MTADAHSGTLAPFFFCRRPFSFFEMTMELMQQTEMDAVLSTVGRDEDGKPVKVKEYTAEVFERCRPDDYKMVVKGICLGISKHRIRIAFGVSWRTVRAVEQRLNPTTVAQVKRELSERCFDLGRQWLELVEGDPKLLAAMGPVGFGIVVDKALLLNGEASTIIEHQIKDASTLRAEEAFRPPAQGMGWERGKVPAIGGGANDLIDQSKVIDVTAEVLTIGKSPTVSQT